MESQEDSKHLKESIYKNRELERENMSLLNQLKLMKFAEEKAKKDKEEFELLKKVEERRKQDQQQLLLSNSTI